MSKKTPRLHFSPILKPISKPVDPEPKQDHSSSTVSPTRPDPSTEQTRDTMTLLTNNSDSSGATPELDTDQDPLAYQLENYHPERNISWLRHTHQTDPPTPAAAAQGNTSSSETQDQDTTATSEVQEADTATDLNTLTLQDITADPKTQEADTTSTSEIQGADTPASSDALVTHPPAINTSNDHNTLKTNPHAINLSPPHSPPLIFLPSSSSTGYTLSTLPILTTTETLLPINTLRNALYIPYLQLGHLELTSSLISKICPSDLNGQSCPHDSVFEWTWLSNSWSRCQGGCPHLRLCAALQSQPPAPAPPFSFPTLVAHPEILNYPSTLENIHKAVTAPRMKNRATPYSVLPADHEYHAMYCSWLHHIDVTCSSVRHNEHRRYQNCGPVAQGRICGFGHDLQAARVDSVKTLLPKHKEEARLKRKRPGVVFLDRWGNWCWDKKGVVWRVGKWAEGAVRLALELGEGGTGAEYVWSG